MDNPLYPATMTIGGSSTTYNAPKVLGVRIHADQSFDLQYTFIKGADSSAYDVSGTTSQLYVTAYKNTSYTPVLLVSGVTSDSGSGTTDRVTFTVPADAIPNDIASFPLRTPGNAVFYAIVGDGAGKKIEVVAEVNLFDTDYALTGDANPSAQTIVPIKNDLGSVISSNLTTPPTATLNNAYIVGAGATGDWAGQDDDLAIGTGSDWVFLTPVEGNFVYDENQSIQILFNGSAWVALESPPFVDSVALIKNSADNTKLIGFDASAITTATERTITMPDADIDLGTLGDVSGPGSAIDDNIPTFDTTTGKIIQDSGVNISAVNANTAKVTYPSADSTKVGFITVTQSVDLDTMESDISTNNAKVSNVSTNLTTTQTTTTVDIVSSDGTDATLPQAIAGGNAGVMSGADKTKVDDSISATEAAAGTDNNQTGTTYTFVLTDKDNVTVWFDNAAAIAVTIPTNASVAFPVGTKINAMQEGAGIPTFTGDTGVTVNGVSGGSVFINNQYQGITLAKRAADEWIIVGDYT